MQGATGQVQSARRRAPGAALRVPHGPHLPAGTLCGRPGLLWAPTLRPGALLSGEPGRPELSLRKPPWLADAAHFDCNVTRAHLTVLAQAVLPTA